MSHRHPRDPAGPHRAAFAFGRLVALGLMQRAECVAALAAVVPPPGLDASGLRMRLVHRLDDSTAAWHRARARADRAVRAAVAPLLETGAASAAIRQAARDADRHGALLPQEAEAIAADQAARRLRHRRHG